MSDELRMTPAALSAALKGDLYNALVAATPGGIERQEAEGQRQMASSFKTLPKSMDRETAERFGFTFGDDADEIFVNVTAPDGWSLRPTEHSMHSDIVDDQGRVRGGIFYKAAFYDRRADGHWSTRYRVEADYPPPPAYDVTGFRAVDTATGETLFAEPVTEGEGDKWARRDIAEDIVRVKLEEAFPDYRDVTAYWSA
jgi:hypothetical protein